jgi:hypothetical protein
VTGLPVVEVVGVLEIEMLGIGHTPACPTQQIGATRAEFVGTGQQGTTRTATGHSILGAVDPGEA